MDFQKLIENKDINNIKGVILCHIKKEENLFSDIEEAYFFIKYNKNYKEIKK